MIITTTHDVTGQKTVETLGMVQASSVRARHIGRDLMASLRNIIGGEITEYTKLLSQSRETAVSLMADRAEELGANAIVGTRFVTAGIMSGAAEILVYGTAVVLEKQESK